MGTGLHLELSGEKKAGGDRVQHAITLSGIQAAAVDIEVYSAHGQTGMPNSSGGGHKNAVGAGFIAAVADKAKGVVFVDVSAVDFLGGQAPAQRVLFSREDLAASPVVKAAAKKAGLDGGKLTVDVKDIWLSSGFEDKKVNTLAFEVQVTDKNGKSRKLELSTYVEGDWSKSLSKLKTAELEVGIARSWGWLYPPSAKSDEPKANGATDGGRTRGGDSESSAADLRHEIDNATRGGGGESSAPVVHRGGGGESGGGFVPVRGGGGE
jgi:hypothetical protein